MSDGFGQFDGFETTYVVVRSTDFNDAGTFYIYRCATVEHANTLRDVLDASEGMLLTRYMTFSVRRAGEMTKGEKMGADRKIEAIYAACSEFLQGPGRSPADRDDKIFVAIARTGKRVSALELKCHVACREADAVLFPDVEETHDTAVEAPAKNEGDSPEAQGESSEGAAQGGDGGCETTAAGEPSARGAERTPGDQPSPADVPNDVVTASWLTRERAAAEVHRNEGTVSRWVNDDPPKLVGRTVDGRLYIYPPSVAKWKTENGMRGGDGPKWWTCAPCGWDSNVRTVEKPTCPKCRSATGVTENVRARRAPRP